MAITKVSRNLLNTGVSDSSDATAITINSSENVGIGVTSPDSKLQIANADGSTYRFGFGGTSDCYFDADSVQFRTDNGGAVNAIMDTDGLKFNGDNAAANALDDYEEGSWTPAIAGSTNLTIFNAEYIKIGRKVYGYVYVAFNPVSNSSTFEITGLPYGQSGTHYGSGTLNYTGSANWSDIYGCLIAGSKLYFHKNSGTSATLTNADVYTKTGGGQQYLLASIHFYTA